MFVEYYTTFIFYAPEDPRDELIPALFEYADLDDWCIFSEQIEAHLEGCEPHQVREWWSRWLKSYWENRIQGVPQQFNPPEVPLLLGWMRHLDAVFEEVVELIIQTTAPPDDTKMEPFFRDLNTARFIEKHPRAIAKLLIYLGGQSSDVRAWVSARDILAKLHTSQLPSDLVIGIRELKARLD